MKNTILLSAFVMKWIIHHVFPQCAFKLVSFFKNLGVDYVFDVTLGRDLALIERLLSIGCVYIYHVYY